MPDYDFAAAAPATLVELARRHAAEAGATQAYRFLHCEGAETLSYAEVDALARGVAARLQRDGADTAPAVLLLPTGSAFVAAFFGCLYAGIAAVPVAAPGTAAQLDTLLAILRQSGARTVISERGFRERLLARRGLGEALQPLPWLLVEDCAGEAGAWRETQPQPGATAVLQYTSGSTGRPRGVVVSHANILANQHLIEQGFRHAADAVVVGWLPLFHDMGLVGNLLNPFALRRPCVLMPPQAFLRNPRLWLEAISQFRATTAGGPNFAFELCAGRIDGALDDLDLSRWRVAYVGAEPVRAETLQRFSRKFAAAGFRASAFYPCYGLAEATLIVTGVDRGAAGYVANETIDAYAANAATPGTPDVTVPCGAALGGQQVLVVDTASGLPCVEGQAGEVWIAGPCVAGGYHAEPEASAATFGACLADGRGPFLRSGDTGMFNHGQLSLRGRIKNVVVVNGVNLYAEHLEAWLEQCHPALLPGGVAVFGVQRDGAEALALAAELRRDQLRSLDLEAVANSLCARAAELVAVPLTEVLLCRLGALPRTTSGKIQHWQCAAQLSAADAPVLHRWMRREEESAAPVTAALARSVVAVTAWLRSRIAALSGQPEAAIGVSASFVQLGISSAQALQLTVELAKATGLSLDDTVFWEYPSIDAVAAHVAGLDA